MVARAAKHSPQLARVKLVVSGLPPLMNASEFYQFYADIMKGCQSIEYTRGKSSAEKEVCSIAHIIFGRESEALDFYGAAKDRTIAHGEPSSTFSPNIEFAVFQKVARPPSKTDPRAKSIHKDPHFKTFAEKFDEPITPLASMETIDEGDEGDEGDGDEYGSAGASARAGDDNDVIITPLMRSLMEERKRRTNVPVNSHRSKEQALSAWQRRMEREHGARRGTARGQHAGSGLRGTHKGRGGRGSNAGAPRGGSRGRGRGRGR